MRIGIIALQIFIVCMARAEITSTNIDAGSAVIDLGAATLNAGSTLHRKWVVLNDDACPVRLNATNAVTQKLEDRYFSDLKGSCVVTKTIQAYSITYVLFDAFNQETKTVKPVPFVSDMSPGKEYRLPWTQDPTRFYTCAIFVQSARDSSGDVWSCDLAALNQKLESLHLKRQNAIPPDPKN